MRYQIFVVALLLASACFAYAEISDERKACVRACCENSGGTYESVHNGCDSPGEGFSECAMGCKDPEPGMCPSAILMAGLLCVALCIPRL